MADKLTNEEIIKMYVDRYGHKQAKAVINWVAKEQEWVDAITSEIGQQIMSMHIDRASIAFDNYHTLLNEEGDIQKLSVKTIEARVEYNLCIKIVKDVQARIAKFYKLRI